MDIEKNDDYIYEMGEIENGVSADKLNRTLKHVNGKISVFWEQAFIFKRVYHLLQIIILVGATFVPFLLNIPEVSKVYPTIISGIVAVAIALVNYFKFGERARSLF